MTRSKKMLFAALALVLGVTIGVYSAEIVFRHVLLVPFVPETESDFREIVSRYWPKEVAQSKRPGSIRILGLADSFGVSGGLSNYHHRLESILRQRGYDVEVVSLSVPAYSLEHELALLERFGERYQPDLVLHAFFVGNDFGLGEPATVRYRGIGVTEMEGSSSWLPHNLALSRWVPQWWRARAERRRHAAAARDGGDGGGFTEAAFLDVERVRFGACRLPLLDGPAWPGTTEVLDRVALAIRGLNAGHLLVVHPDQFQIEPALSDEIVDTYELDRLEYDVDLPQKFLQAYATSRNVPIVDLTDAFREQGSEGGLFLLRDTHYNEAGNELAARILADALEPGVALMSGIALK